MLAILIYWINGRYERFLSFFVDNRVQFFSNRLAWDEGSQESCLLWPFLHFWNFFKCFLLFDHVNSFGTIFLTFAIDLCTEIQFIPFVADESCFLLRLRSFSLLTLQKLMTTYSSQNIRFFKWNLNIKRDKQNVRWVKKCDIINNAKLM